MPATSGSIRPASRNCRRSHGAQIPWQYDDLKGPNYKNVDLALSKRVRLKGTSRLNFRIEAYNLLNNMNWGLPNTNITQSTFGQVLTQADAYFGQTAAVHAQSRVLESATQSRRGAEF